SLHCAAVNQAPTVSVTPPACAQIQGNGTATLTLSGSVNDAVGTLIHAAWSVLTAPNLATAKFHTPIFNGTIPTGQPLLPSTALDVNSPGIYIFRLTADDGTLVASSDVTAFV